MLLTDSSRHGQAGNKLFTNTVRLSDSSGPAVEVARAQVAKSARSPLVSKLPPIPPKRVDSPPSLHAALGRLTCSPDSHLPPTFDITVVIVIRSREHNPILKT